MTDPERDVAASLRSYGASMDVDVVPVDDVIRRARRRRRATASAVTGALLAGVVATILMATSGGGDRRVVPALDGTTDVPSTDTPGPSAASNGLASLLEVGESRVLPPSPLAGRSDPAGVWTGDELLIWSGVVFDPASGESSPSDGAAYDPIANSWTSLPEAPIAGRGYAAAVWTGEEMLVWGGGVDGSSVSDGAAYNPTTKAWRPLPTFSMTNTIRPTAIWTGTEMIVLEGINGGDHGAAYNPASDTWRTIAAPPGRSVTPYPQAVWTGDRAIVELGAGINDQPILAEYDPIGDAWQTMDPPQIASGARPALVWTGAELLMLGGGGDGPKAAWDPASDTWRLLLATNATLLNNTPVWTGDAVLFWNGGNSATAYLPANDSWQVVPGGSLSERIEPVMVWADGLFLTWSGFQNRPDGTAFGAADGLLWRPDLLHAVPSDTIATTSPPAAVTTTRAVIVGPAVTEPSPSAVTEGATEHQLEVLAAAFSMPGRPDLHDVSGGAEVGQEVTAGSRTLVVNVPLAGSWQYSDLDAQSLPAATQDSSEAAARSLLAALGIDAEGQTATFTPNGPFIDVGLAGCTMHFAADGRIVSAIGPITAIP